MAKTSKKAQVEPVMEPDESEQLSESYISIGLGLLVVIVVGILLYNYFTQKKTNDETTADASPEVSQEATSAARPGGTYTVQSGDTLWSIAEKSYNNGFDWKQIADANNISSNDQLTQGQQLKIPELKPESSDMAMTSGAPAASDMKPEASPAEVMAQPTAMPQEQTKGGQAMTGATITGTSYTVQAGDTLWDIACRAYGDCYQWKKIADANKLADPDLIYSGNVFTIPR